MDRFAQPPAPGLAIAPYWPAAFWGPAAVLSVVLILMRVCLCNRPEDVGLPPIEQYRSETPTQSAEHSTHPAPVALPDSDNGTAWTAIREVLADPCVWLLAIAYFPIKLARYSFYLWGPKFVAESLGTTAFTSNFTAAWMPIGGVVGVILSGYVSDKLFGARRAPVIIFSLLLTAVVMLTGLTQIHNLWVMRGFFFFVGVFIYGPDSMVSATAAIDFGTKHRSGTATGFVNGVGSLGAILGGFLPSVLTNESDWTLLFQITLVGLVLSAIILTPLWGKRPPTA